MDSLLTLPPGGFLAVDLALRVAAVLVTASATLLALSASCVPAPRRLPLLIAAVGLGGAAWFEMGVSGAWRGAFELAGSSYCVTGLPTAGDDRILAWAFGLPAIIFCLGLVLLDHASGAFRILCWSSLALAVLGPVSNLAFLIGFLVCADQLRRAISPFSGKMSAFRASPGRVAVLSCLLSITGMIGGILLTEAGRLGLLPLGKTADSILVHGEIIHAASDILALVVPALALLTVVLNPPEKE